MTKGNDKGLITLICTIVNLIIGAAVAIGMITGISIAGNQDTWALVVSIIWLVLDLVVGAYFIWHSVMIIIGKKSNTWTYVVISFFVSWIIGGIIMLVAKLLN